MSFVDLFPITRQTIHKSNQSSQLLTVKQKNHSFEKISSSTKVMSKPIQVQFVHTEPTFAERSCGEIKC